jgi:hypothetical protein
MKRVLILTVFAILAASVSLAEMTDVRIGGEIRVRGEKVTSGADGIKDQGRVPQRLRVNLNARMNETTKGYVSLQDSRIWGKEEDTADTGDEKEAVDVSQAWFQLDQVAGQPVSVRVGRQALEYGDQRLVGSFEWSNNARRFDALKLVHSTETYSIDLWTAKVVEKTVDAPGDNTADDDLDFRGLYVTVKTVPNNIVDLYLLEDKNDATERDVLTYGLRLEGRLARLDYTGEVAKQTGDFDADSDQDALAYAVKAGYTFPGKLGLRIGAEYAFATGDDRVDNKEESFQNLYPENHYLYGLTDDIDWSNISAWSVNAGAKPAKDLWIGAEYWVYRRAEDVQAVDKGGADVAGKGTDDAGTEMNLTARYTLNPNVKLEAAWVRRTNGDAKGTEDYYGRQMGKDKSADFAYIMANVTF